jgi:hypothetical protein
VRVSYRDREQPAGLVGYLEVLGHGEGDDRNGGTGMADDCVDVDDRVKFSGQAQDPSSAQIASLGSGWSAPISR